MDTPGRKLTKKGEPMSTFVPRLSKDSAAVQGGVVSALLQPDTT